MCNIVKLHYKIEKDETLIEFSFFLKFSPENFWKKEEIWRKYQEYVCLHLFVCGKMCYNYSNFNYAS